MPAALGIFANDLVQNLPVIAQFSHRAQHEHASAPLRCEHVNCRTG